MAGPQRQLPHSLQFNCGFARCAVRELSVSQQLNREACKNKFLELFPNYGLSTSYFQSSKGRYSLFEKYSKILAEAWRKRWNPSSSRTAYEDTFSINKWKILSSTDQQKHTLACCNECSISFQELQKQFPLKPHHEKPQLISFNEQVLQQMGTKDGTQKAMEELNEKYADTFNKSFTESLLQHGGENLQVWRPVKIAVRNTLQINSHMLFRMIAVARITLYTRSK